MVRFIAQTSPDFWLPESASTYAHNVDWLFYLLFYISIFFFVLIGGLMFFFVIKYRRRDRDDKPHGQTHNTTLEITWTIIPLIIVMSIFVWGFRGFLGMSTPPGDSYEVLVTAWRWEWEFTYPDGTTSSREEGLHVPSDRPIRLVMNSTDVLHSFYVPEFRIKKDVVPRRYNKTWFEVESKPNGITMDNPGVYNIYCAEYCGKNHSQMRSHVIVHMPEDFDRWLARKAAENPLENISLLEYGEQIFKRKSCVQCHSLDGSALTGPTFLNQFGYPLALQNGEAPIVDENFLRQGIEQPNSHDVRGFDPQMPQIPLKNLEITALITFIKSQSDKYTPDPRETQVGGTKKGAEGPSEDSKPLAP